jgi:hypothetical protein
MEDDHSTPFCLLVLLALIQTVSPAYGDQSLEVWEKFSLEKLPGSLATVYYDKSLAGDPHKALAIYEAYVAERMVPAERRGDAFIAKLNQLVGLEPDAEFRDVQTKMLSSAQQALRLSAPNLCLIPEEKVKAYLEGDGSLPNLGYDKSDRKVSINLDFGAGDKGKRITSSITLPVHKERTMEQDVQKLVDMMRLTFPSIETMSTQMLAGMTVARHFKGVQDPHTRWFTEGAAIVIAERLRREQDKDVSGDTDPKKYEDLKGRLNLVQWAADPWNSRIDVDSRLTQARRVYAATEVRRLVGAHGVDVIGSILSKAKAQPQDRNALVSALQQVTGEDFALRLTEYQSFKTTQEGIALYAKQFDEAQDRKDWKAALEALLRVRELRDAPNVGDYAMIAGLLLRLNHERAADEVFERILDLTKKAGNAELQLTAKKLYLEYCLEAKKPTAAADVALEVLLVDEHNLPAMTIRMLDLQQRGRASEAKDLAAQIIKLDETPTGNYRAAATRVQSQLPSKTTAPSPSQFRLLP